MLYLVLMKMCIRGADKLEHEEQRLIDALLNSPITELKELNLRHNYEWFKFDEAASSIAEFIKSQTQLKKLILRDNIVKYETKQVINAWDAQSPTYC